MILPGEEIDQAVVRTASRARWGELLAAGITIFKYEPTMFHTKLFIVDSAFVSIGSANFDNRSFHLNDEATVNVFNEQFAQQQEAIFEEDKKKSKRITHEDWENRPFWERATETALLLIRSQL